MNPSTIATHPLKGFLAAALMLAGPAGAFAMPHAGATAVDLPIQRVAMGCGMGRAHDAMGHCRHRFNLFDHHDRRHFRAYRQNHCAMIETPNGRVRRCRI